MRLGQLARKLALRPDQIVEFLAKKDIHIEDGSNTRLEDHHVALLVEKFAPNGLDITPQEATPDEVITPVITPEIVIPEEVPVPEIEPVELNASPTPTENPTIEIPVFEEKTEVIKAPKVELSGLKVLGKIDLPEPKKKEAPIIPAEQQLDSNKLQEPRTSERKRPAQNRNARTNSRSVQNPIALQREREEQELQKKREAAHELEKEKRAQHYFNKVKVVAPVKSPKRERVIEEIAEPVLPPKTLLGKFFRWFRS